MRRYFLKKRIKKLLLMHDDYKESRRFHSRVIERQQEQICNEQRENRSKDDTLGYYINREKYLINELEKASKLKERHINLLASLKIKGVDIELED